MKKAIYFLTLILLSTLAVAQLEISPSSFTIVSDIGEEQTKEVTFTNNFNYSIFNFTFTDNTFITQYPEIIELQPNTSTTKTFKFLSNEQTVQSFNIITKFTYLTDVNAPPKTHNITITDTQFEPLTIDIKQADSVLWINNDSIPHTVSSHRFDYVIQPNQTRLLQLNDIETINYVDNNIGYTGTINVLNKSKEYTNNPNNNKIIYFTMNSDYESAELEIESLTSNFSVRYNDSEEGLLRVKNVGQARALDINVSAEKWISFDTGLFNLEPNAEKYLIYTISPVILNKSQTDKTYVITLSAFAENANNKETDITVYLPEEDEIELYNNLTREQLVEQINALRTVLDGLDLSSPNQEPIIEYRDSTIGVNLTEEDVLADRRRLTGIETMITDSSKYQNDEINAIKTILSQQNDHLTRMEALTNESLVLGKENKEEVEDNKKFTSVLIDTFLIIILGGAITFFLLKHTRKKRELIQ